MNEDIENWHGVSVDDKGRVIGLDLSNNNLTGDLPKIIAKLTQLQTLYLYSNNLIEAIRVQPMLVLVLTVD
jgi:Leucine-rich repeat (LRR) protein